MKKIRLLAILMLASTLAAAQQSTLAVTPEADGIVHTSVNVPYVRYQTPTAADIYCAGFITKNRIPDANYVNGGLETPTSTKFEMGELVYLAGSGYQTGQLYSVVREMRDINEYEIYPGMRKVLAATGRPYGDIGRIRIVDTRSHSAIAQVEFSCDPINPGDVVVPFEEKPPVAFHVPGRFDRFAPPNSKLSGRIVLGRDFDGFLGTGMKLYMNMGSNQGVKVGDYFRVLRSYTATLENPVDSLSFKAQISEDTQMRPPTFEANRFDKSKGPNIHVRDLPRHAVGEVVVLNVTPTSSSAMVVFALEDVHAGDFVELDEQQQQ
jgi:phage terminase large subunit-like protein